MTYDNTNKGALWKNDRKETENHPDYTGKLNIDGNEKRLAAWVKKDKNGKNFMSLQLSEFTRQGETAQQPPKTQAQTPVYDDDIPF